MPLVAHTPLPSFDRLKQRGQEVLTLDRAETQDIRELHIGLLNMMPDAALQITERQFLRLVGNCNQIAQFYVHVFSVPGLTRSRQSESYIDRFYTTFERIQRDGLDALIITGANVVNPQPGPRELLAAADRCHRMGAGECHIDALLLPVDACLDEILLWHRAGQARAQEVGRL